ncbi:hypothetical protein [Paenibacillus sp. SYP-B4298]|uniref:hypothetical protein n=1 Tax=Paenibacillus sp. SYP-B4298 TaxID=2996034 RepID=UPI0022DCFA89|nr:hypothetical protein [Paenibacillus sp. SYP-B4298]
MNWIPAAKSGKWFWWTVVTVLAVTGLLWLIRFGLYGQAWTWPHALRFLLLSAVLGLISGVCGWLGARWLWGFTVAGTLGGLMLMVFYVRDMNGWEDLVSLLAFFEAVAAGLIIGGVAELIALGLRLWRNR